MENKIEQNFKILVLGNNQDGCLMTKDNQDVTEFRKIIDEDLEFLAAIDQNNFRISTGMNICAAYLKNKSSFINLWGRMDNSESNHIKLNFPKNVKKCVIGDSHLIILLNNGDVYVAGEGPQGQLGRDEEMIVDKLCPLKLKLNTKINKIYIGVRTSFYIDENKNLFCCGSNRNNELGLISEKNKDDINLLIDIKSPIKNHYLSNMKSVQCGFKHTIFITESYDIYGAGDNSKGVLGFESKENLELIIKKEIIILAKLSKLWNLDEEFKKIKCGWNNTLVLTGKKIYLFQESGKVYSTGYGRFGQLGFLINNKIPSLSYVFNQVTIPKDIIINDIIAGSDYFIAVDKDKYLYSWGWNEHFNLGLSHNKNVAIPQCIKSEIFDGFRDSHLKIKTGGAFLMLYNINQLN